MSLRRVSVMAFLVLALAATITLGSMSLTDSRFQDTDVSAASERDAAALSADGPRTGLDEADRAVGVSWIGVGALASAVALVGAMVLGAGEVRIEKRRISRKKTQRKLARDMRTYRVVRKGLDDGNT